jgi:hypothetical protein
MKWRAVLAVIGFLFGVIPVFTNAESGSGVGWEFSGIDQPKIAKSVLLKNVFVLDSAKQVDSLCANPNIFNFIFGQRPGDATSI